MPWFVALSIHSVFTRGQTEEISFSRLFICMDGKGRVEFMANVEHMTPSRMRAQDGVVCFWGRDEKREQKVSQKLVRPLLAILARCRPVLLFEASGQSRPTWLVAQGRHIRQPTPPSIPRLSPHGQHTYPPILSDCRRRLPQMQLPLVMFSAQGMFPV